MKIDSCSRCGAPCHASESDDDGVGLCCSAYTVDFNGCTMRYDSEAAALEAIEHNYPSALIDTTPVIGGGVSWSNPATGTILAVMRRAVRS